MKKIWYNSTRLTCHLEPFNAWQFENHWSETSLGIITGFKDIRLDLASVTIGCFYHSYSTLARNTMNARLHPLESPFEPLTLATCNVATIRAPNRTPTSNLLLFLPNQLVADVVSIKRHNSSFAEHVAELIRRRDACQSALSTSEPHA